MVLKWKDVGRVANGVSLVANEMAKRSEVLENAARGDIETLIKKALLSATDLARLTKGSPQHFSSQSPFAHAPQSSSTHSVVYFHNDNNNTCEDHNQQQQEHLTHKNNNGNDKDYTTSIKETTTTIDTTTTTGSTVIAEDKAAAANQGPSNFESLSITINDNNTATAAQDHALEGIPPESQSRAAPPRRKPRERRVPSTPFSRALGFAGLGAGLAWGTLQESTKRLVYGAPTSPNNQSALSPFLSDKNAERLALALCRMRGAALKIGQMLSIQDESLVPPPILAALEIVRQGADVMPRKQLNEVLNAELGQDWSSKLTSFDYEPMAAASIGQVHRAVTRDGLQVAMKIQYPGVANSIDSDIENVKLLLDYTNLIPKGLYLDRAIKVAKEELSRECDYYLEAQNQKRFRDLLSGTEGFYVPVVVDDLSSKRVLTSELVTGIPIDKVALLEEGRRNYVGKRLLELTLLELFVFRFMQTDPNWGNFLYDETTNTMNLIDFGAARDFPKSFVDDYLRMVIACANGDKDAVIEMSRRLGFLTGQESEIMLDAHAQAGFVVGLPFSKPGGYDFRSSNITQSISNLGATMLRHRLTPPPDEAYSLHRKLSGAFLACIKLGAVVPCRELLLEVCENYQFGEYNGQNLASGSV